MSASIFRRLLYGAEPVPETIQGIPPGARVRLRRRPDDFTKVFIRMGGGISLHYIERQGDGPWRITEPYSENRRWRA